LIRCPLRPEHALLPIQQRGDLGLRPYYAIDRADQNIEIPDLTLCVEVSHFVERQTATGLLTPTNRSMRNFCNASA